MFSPRSRIILPILLILAMPVASRAQTVLNFETAVLPGTYGGFSWTNWGVWSTTSNRSTYAYCCPEYYSIPTFSRDTDFDFLTADLRNTNLAAQDFTFTGYNNGVLLYTAAVGTTQSWENYVFNWRGVDEVRVTHNNVTNMLMDNFAFQDTMPDTTIPEPMSLVLLGSGLIGVAGAVRRGKKRRTESL